ncbi:hypothetical protein SmJEL517_g04094 [Synchytrium microbalum]|uniref:HECT-type E3 ubiquitin transferase n=1 Tax=Synchytrium microbalum TaxID=1806994 RepID=A0A507C0J6_9FUNG|nr:uncharacterized protein SmJEL517_g04094 [Synchytrium microbalum]TPX32888.1 hypothetical protein SmJEL517_g04094 [Synchytrium microbalum]
MQNTARPNYVFYPGAIPTGSPRPQPAYANGASTSSPYPSPVGFQKPSTPTIHRSYPPPQSNTPQQRPEPPQSNMVIDKPDHVIAVLTTGTCQCCGHLLRFPQTIRAFRCTVCETVNDLDPVPMPGGGDIQAHRLSLERLRALINASQHNRPSAELLEKTIADSFSLHASINESFSSNQPISETDCGVNLGDVRIAYKLLLTSPAAANGASRNTSVDSITQSMEKLNITNTRMSSVLVQATDKLLKRPGRRLVAAEDVKFLLILLENPVLLTKTVSNDLIIYHDILGRIFGLMSCLSNDMHHFIVAWLAQLPIDIFQKRVDVVNFYISRRLSNKEGMRDHYPQDWGIKSAARVMALLFAANQSRPSPKLVISDFYNTVVDYVDLIRDFMRWQEERSGAFSFCQYPFLVSLGGKMTIVEADAKRQMQERFKEAFYRTAIHNQPTDPFFSIHVRRNNLIADSLNSLSARNVDFKKKLRIEFVDEQGIDLGGLTKEWFLLLTRDLFDQQFGMFDFDEDSYLCWFNQASMENSEEYRLVGTIIGLAIYNNTILDVHFPNACYKKLFSQPVGLDDLKVLHPALGRGLQSLLDYDGDDVEAVFCRDFVAEYTAYGDVVRVPLVPNGDSIAVTNANREKYVELMVDFLLNRSVQRQFDAFKEGFMMVCGGNALSLFRPEEIEMMVRGGTELDIESLAGVCEYEGFSPTEPTMRNFWDIAKKLPTDMKRKLLLFITGTDRIPATGIQNMPFKISCLGDDSEKLPVSHTCFNQLCLYRYKTREKLEAKLMKAITWRMGYRSRVRQTSPKALFVTIQAANLQDLCDAVKIVSLDTAAHAMKMDLASESRGSGIVDQTLKLYGRFDVFFVNGGILGESHQILDEVNALSPLLGCDHGARGMLVTSKDKPSSRGSIIITSSIAALGGGTASIAYGSSKAAVVNMGTSSTSP